MTSDAKIGLLLGLVFIFVIAFIVNGLPSFRSDRSSNELTTNMVGLQDRASGLAARERKVSREVAEDIEPVKKQRVLEVRAPSTDSEDVRFKMSLPRSTSVVKGAREAVEIKRSKSTVPKVYVVSEDDNLSVIAKKLYGAEAGNKRVNITRIFEANRSVLRSPDEIYVGQKLVIPPPAASVPDEGKDSGVLAGPVLEKVESIGKRHLPTDGSGAKQGRQYVVLDGDSLWRIAAEQLGEGSRYNEIAKLNAGILEDNLVVGMRLKLPAR